MFTSALSNNRHFDKNFTKFGETELKNSLKSQFIFSSAKLIVSILFSWNRSRCNFDIQLQFLHF